MTSGTLTLLAGAAVSAGAATLPFQHHVTGNRVMFVVLAVVWFGLFVSACVRERHND